MMFLICLEFFFLVYNDAGIALKMLDKDSDLATHESKDKQTALHVLARKPSAFAQPGILRTLINSCELL